MSENNAPSEALMERPKTKAKIKTKTKAKNVEIESVVDLITTVAYSVENASSTECDRQIVKLLEDVDNNYFALGGYLSLAQREEGWRGQFENFKDFVETSFGLNYRKAMYLIAMYKGIVESGVVWEQVSHLGWTKLKELASIITTDNVADWILKAENMTVSQLIAAIKLSETGVLEKTDTPTESNPTSSMSFSVHEDQKVTIESAVEKAKLEADTDNKSVALEALCMNYLSGGKVAQPIEIQMKVLGAEAVLEAFEVVFPDIDLMATMP